MLRRLYIKWLVWRGKAVDIGSDCEGPAGLLSNFIPYEFSFREYNFVSMEGLLQGLNFEGTEKQQKIFKLIGKQAKFKGKKRKWYLDQRLYWQGKPMARQSEEYISLVREAFDALACNKEFQKALLATGDKKLFHTMGKFDPTKTILTEDEFCTILTEVRTKLRLTKEMKSYINDIYPGINFCYPKEYVEYDSKVYSFNWCFPKGVPFLKDQLSFLQKTHGVNKLIPFAMNNADGNAEPYEYACFIIDGIGNNRIKIIWPFGNHDSFFQKEYEDINDWFENM